MNHDIEEKPTADRQVLIVRTGGILACVDLCNVERTISLVAMQAIPGSAPYVAGIINYAGSSMAVIDLAIRLGLHSSPYTLDTPIMICVHQQQRIGVILQDIVGIQTLQQQDQQLTRQLGGQGLAFCASVHTVHGLALLLDAAWLAQSELYQGRAESVKENPYRLSVASCQPATTGADIVPATLIGGRDLDTMYAEIAARDQQ